MKKKNKKDCKKCCFNCQYFNRESLICNRFDLDLQSKKNSFKFYCIEFLYLYNKKVYKHKIPFLTENRKNYMECIKELRESHD